MPDVEVCLHSTILRFSQNVIILYKFKLGVLIPCNARLTTVRVLSHSKQPQYALSRTILTGLGRCTSIAVRRFNYLGQIEATLRTSLPNRIIASCPFEISSTGKKKKFIWSPIFKVIQRKFLHSYRLTKADKKERSKATRSSNHVNVYAINKHLWWKFIFLGLMFLFDRLSLMNSVLQIKPKPLEASSVHHDARRLSIDIKMSFVS